MPDLTLLQRAVSSVLGDLILGRLKDGIKPVPDDDGRHHMGIICPATPGYQGRHRVTGSSLALMFGETLVRYNVGVAA